MERVPEPDGRGVAVWHYECPAFHCTYSWQKASQWLPRGGVEGEGQEGVITERQEETTEGMVMDTFIIYMELMVSQMCTHVSCTLEIRAALSYPCKLSIKLLKNRENGKAFSNTKYRRCFQ